jgi:hypothetical protein
MKELVQHAFDFFGYVIPGLFIIFSVSILAVPINDIDTAISLTKQFDIGLGTVMVIVAYVIGFCIYPVGRFLYKTIGFKLFGNHILEDSNQNNLSVPTKYALLREHSPMNFKYVESWNIYCAMSHNLMVASLFFAAVSIIKIASGADTLLWTGALLAGIIIFFILTHRAVTYFHWAAYDINATISSLKLKEK